MGGYTLNGYGLRVSMYQMNMLQFQTTLKAETYKLYRMEEQYDDKTGRKIHQVLYYNLNEQWSVAPGLNHDQYRAYVKSARQAFL